MARDAAKVEAPGPTAGAGPCAVCGNHDARALVATTLGAGQPIVLCGSHDLMLRRSGAAPSTLGELRMLLEERRELDRRGGRGEVDELAERLTAAFTNDRRGVDRRAS